MRSSYNTMSPVRVGGLQNTPASTHRTASAAHTPTNTLHFSTIRHSSRARSTAHMGRTIGGNTLGATNSGIHSTTSTARMSANRFPEHPTSETKLRLVFEELDLNSNGKVDVDGFRRVFKALHLNLTTPTVEDLFSRADVYRNGWIAFSEYLNWAHHYPALVDSLYFRSRELVEKSRREAALDSTTGPLEELSRKERAAQSGLEAATAAVEEKDYVVRQADDTHRVRVAEESEASRALVDAEKEADLARARRNACDSELIIGKEKEKNALTPLNDMRRHIAVVEDKVVGMEQGLGDLKQREKELLEALADVRRDHQKGQDALAIVNRGLNGAQDEEKALERAYTAAITETQALMTAVDAACEEINARAYEQSKAEAAHQHATNELKNAYAVKNSEERQLPSLQEAEIAAKANHENTTRALEAAGVEIKRLTAELNQYLEARAEQEMAELPLIEGEVRLREQRFNLDDRDTFQSNQLTTFAASINRTRA